MERLSEPQRKILSFIRSEIQIKGYPPSVREIADAMGLRSTATVHGHLQRLEKRGLIRRDPQKPRALELVYNDETTAVTRVPVLGRIQPGLPLMSEQHFEDYVLLPAVMLGRGRHLIVRVTDGGMAEAGLLQGDYLVIRVQDEVKDRDIAAVLLEDGIRIRRVFRGGTGLIRLQPEADGYLPISLMDPAVLGVAVSSFRLIQ